MTTRPERWLQDHKDYPHKDWCLVWPFGRDPRVGRGIVRTGPGKPKLPSGWAHRVMCEMVHGTPPTPQHQAAHSCGNGHLGCVNPHHLSWKTNSENQLERYRVHERGLAPNPYGNRGHYTPEQISEIRRLYAEGNHTQVKLAEMFGCSLGTIQYYLKYRETRGHEPEITVSNGEQQ